MGRPSSAPRPSCCMNCVNCWGIAEGPALHFPAQGPREGPGEQGEPGLTGRPLCCARRAGRLSPAGCPPAQSRRCTFPSLRRSGPVLRWCESKRPVSGRGTSPGSTVTLLEETRTQSCLWEAGACLQLPKGAALKFPRDAGPITDQATAQPQRSARAQSRRGHWGLAALTPLRATGPLA